MRPGVVVGAILAMIVDTMIPEAFETTHNLAGLIASAAIGWGRLREPQIVKTSNRGSTPSITHGGKRERRMSGTVTEQTRLIEAREAGIPWKKWGPLVGGPISLSMPLKRSTTSR
jgi:hypothetical protein